MSERLGGDELAYVRRLVKERHDYLCFQVDDLDRRLGAYGLLSRQQSPVARQYARQRERVAEERRVAEVVLAALAAPQPTAAEAGGDDLDAWAATLCTCCTGDGCLCCHGSGKREDQERPHPDRQGGAGRP